MRAIANGPLLWLGGMQMIFYINWMVMLTMAAIVSYYLLPTGYLFGTTLPLAIMAISAMIASYPANIILQTSAKTGMLVAHICSISWAGLSCLALLWHNFAIFLLAASFMGIYHAFSGYIRFLALDNSQPKQHLQTLMFIMIFAVIGALLVPPLIITQQNTLLPVPFAGIFGSLLLINTSGILLALQLRPCCLRPKLLCYRPRQLQQMLLNPDFSLAITMGMVAGSVMYLLMSSMPLVMLNCGYRPEESIWAIQSHVLVMCAPALFSKIIMRSWGLYGTLWTGLVTLAASCALYIGYAQDFIGFFLAMLLLGIGWNFCFISATTLLTRCYYSCEKLAVQSFNETLVMGSIAMGCLLSAPLYQIAGNWGIGFMGLLITTIGIVTCIHRQSNQSIHRIKVNSSRS